MSKAGPTYPMLVQHVHCRAVQPLHGYFVTHVKSCISVGPLRCVPIPTLNEFINKLPQQNFKFLLSLICKLVLDRKVIQTIISILIAHMEMTTERGVKLGFRGDRSHT